MYFRLLHNIYYCSVFYSFLYKASLVLLVLSFFLYLRGKEKETRPKKKKTLAVFLRPSVVQTEWMNSAMPNLFSLANLRFALQTVLGFALFASLAQ